MERTRCPACGSGAVGTLLSRDFAHPSVWAFVRERYARRVGRRELAGRRHEVARCALCRLLFHRYVLADASLVRLYDEWCDGSPRPDGLHSARAREDTGRPAAPAAPAGEARRLLDLGAGDGRYCEAARERGWDAVAIEIAPRRLERLRDRGLEAYARVDDLAAGGIALARCHEILEHVPRPLDTLRALASRLAPGGRIEVCVPDAERMAPRLPCAYWSAGDDALRPLEHVNGFTPRTLAVLARTLGLACEARTPAPRRWERLAPRRGPDRLRVALVRPGSGGMPA